MTPTLTQSKTHATGSVVCRVTRFSGWSSFIGDVRRVDGSPLMKTGERSNPYKAEFELREYCEDNGLSVHHWETRDI